MNSSSSSTNEKYYSRPFKCYICGAEFPSKADFQVHARVADHSKSRVVVLQLPATITSERFLEIARDYEPKLIQAWVKKYNKTIERNKWVGDLPEKRGSTVQMIVGYVVFQDDATRDHFVDIFDGETVEGSTVKAEPVIKGPTLLVKDIGESTDEETIKEHFSKYNPIKTSIKLLHGRRSARVTFSSVEDRENALTHCDPVIDGCQVRFQSWKSRFEIREIIKERDAKRSAQRASKKEPLKSERARKESKEEEQQAKTLSKDEDEEEQEEEEEGGLTSITKIISDAAAAAGVYTGTPQPSGITPTPSAPALVREGKKEAQSIVMREEKPKWYSVEITNLPPEVDDVNIVQIFEGYEVLEKKLDRSNHKALAYFETEEIAKDVAFNVNEIEVNGNVIAARYIKPPKSFKIEIIRPSSSKEKKEAEERETAAKGSKKDNKREPKNKQEKETEPKNEKEKEGKKEETPTTAVPEIPAKKTFKIYVGNLDSEIDSAQLKGMFLTYNCKHAHVFTDGRRSLEYGIVVFETEDDMYTAIEAMDGRTISGKDITIKVFKSAQQQKEQQQQVLQKGKVGGAEEVNRLRVSLFPWYVKEKDIEGFLNEFNPIAVELRNGKGGKYAVVEFASEKDMRDAFEFMEKTPYNRRKLNVQYEKSNSV